MQRGLKPITISCAVASALCSHALAVDIDGTPEGGVVNVSGGTYNNVYGMKSDPANGASVTLNSTTLEGTAGVGPAIGLYGGYATGASGGEPRNVASPDINTEDFSAAVDFLSLLPEVNSDKIGVLGVCGFGGLVLNAAAMDTRIKAVASSVMYDMSRAMGHGVGDGRDRYTKADRGTVLKYLNAKRLEEARAGHPIPGGHDIAVVNGAASAGDRILPETFARKSAPDFKRVF